MLVCNPQRANEFKSEGYEIINPLRNTNMLLPDDENAILPGLPESVNGGPLCHPKEAIAKSMGYGYSRLRIKPLREIQRLCFLTPAASMISPKPSRAFGEAGYPDGSRPSSSAQQSKRFYTAVQANLAAVGIQADIDIADRPGAASIRPAAPGITPRSTAVSD
jgi:hypothetical protein